MVSSPQFSPVIEAESVQVWKKAAQKKDSPVLLSGGFSVNLHLCMSFFLILNLYQHEQSHYKVIQGVSAN